jgi:tetratricopeptide (TPR) repeat protein
MAQLNAAIRIEPDSAKAYESLGRLQLLQKDFSGAREAFEKALTLRPEDTGARLGMAEALIESGELERAEETLRKLSSRTEGRAGLHKLWGDLYEQRCLYPEAVEEYRAAQLIARQDADASTIQPESFSPPTIDDLEAWKQLAASLKKTTDAYRNERRSRIALSPEEIDYESRT